MHINIPIFIAGSILILFLMLVYIIHRMNYIKRKKLVLKSPKEIKRVYYTLKMNGFKLKSINKKIQLKIKLNEEKVINEYVIDAICKKGLKEYICLLKRENSEDMKNLIITGFLLTGIKNGIIIDINNYEIVMKYKVRIKR